MNTAYTKLKSGTKRLGIFYRLWTLMLTVTLIYTFYFQYGVKSINNAMMMLCAIDIFFSLIYIFVIRKGKFTISPYTFFILFVFVSFFIGYFISSGGAYGFDLGLRMVEYVLTAYSLYLLIGDSEEYLLYFMKIICVSVAILAISMLVKGVVVTSTGALGLVGLNVNEMSSYFIFMVACSFVLLGKCQKTIVRFIIIIADMLVVIAQIEAASRRGFIVIMLLVFTGIVFGLIPYSGKNNSTKRFVYYTIVVAAICVGAVLFRDYIIQSTVLGSRLGGSLDNGDIARHRYQAYAMEQFKLHPLVGIGIGGVAHAMGAYSHSLYYEIFACTGIIGAVILLIGLLKIGIQLFKTYRICCRNNEFKDQTLMLCIGGLYWMCIMLSGFSVVMIYDCYFYLSIALLTSIIKVNRNRLL